MKLSPVLDFKNISNIWWLVHPVVL